MHPTRLALAALFLTQAACAQEGPQGNTASSVNTASDETIFKAAGFAFSDGAWRKCGDPGTISYEAGTIRERSDFNADGLPDAIVTEGGTYCFGMAGAGFSLVSQSSDGSWRIMAEQIGIPRLLETKGAQGWPDIEVGGPGFCFPVMRWNGSQYALHRHEYEGAPCNPGV